MCIYTLYYIYKYIFKSAKNMIQRYKHTRCPYYVLCIYIYILCTIYIYLSLRKI